MVKDAELNAVADHALMLLAESRNKAESQIHSIRKSLVALGKTLDAEDLRAIEVQIIALETALDAGDAAKIDAMTSSLSDAAIALQKKAADASAPAAAQPEEDALDAEFKETSK